MADLNGDGLPDIVALNYSIDSDPSIGSFVNLGNQFPSSGARVYLNAGNGQFKEYQQFYFDYTLNQAPPNNLQLSSNGAAVTAVALGDVNGDGCIDAVTLDTQDIATFFPGSCDGTFDTANTRIFGSGIMAGAAALVDVNGDGKLDLVSSAFSLTLVGTYLSYPNFPVGNAVSVQLGDGTGNFSTPTIFRGESGMFSMAIGDLNGDGYPDIVTANQDTDTVSVYLNNGQGGFGPPSGGYLGYLMGGQMHAVFDSPVSNFLYADVNNDGNSDLVVLESGAQYPLPYALTVLPGNGTGGFGAPLRSSVLDLGPNQEVIDFTLADFRSTGLPDLLLLDYQGGSSLPTATPAFALAKNNGDGTFQKPTLTPLGNISPIGSVVGDFNNDGKLDVLLCYITCVASGTCAGPAVQPYLGNGDGTFRPGTPVAFNTAGSPTIRGILAVDVNGDGKLDLQVSGDALISSSEANGLYELIGKGDGTFEAPKLLFSNPGSNSYFATGDFNKDEIPDLVEEALDDTFAMRTFRTYLGQSDSTFKLTGTFGPFTSPNSIYGLLYGAPNKPLWPLEPTLGDFNGDGNLDVMMFEQNIDGLLGLGGLTIFQTGIPTSLQVLAGNGDGTFTPANIPFNLLPPMAPQLYVATTGDKRADLVEIDGYSSAYDIVTAQPGPAFSLAMVSSPVTGTTGKVQVALAFPSGAASTVKLSASDPNISLPASVSFPAGTVSQDVSFQIGAGFNPTHVIALTGQMGSETHTAYTTQASSASGAGFTMVILNQPTSPPVITPSESFLYNFAAISLGGYSTVIQPSCQGLPAGANCQWSPTPISLGPGYTNGASVNVNAGLSTPSGTYSPTAAFADGTFTQKIPIPFVVQGAATAPDFTIGIAPPSATVTAGQSTNFGLTLSSENGLTGAVSLQCSNLPSGAACGFNPASPALTANASVSDTLTVQVSSSVAAGSYPFTVTATSGSLVHAASATLQVQAPPGLSGSVSPTSASVTVGQSANFTVKVNSQNGAAGTVNLQCAGLPSGTTCSFNPTAPTLASNGTVSDTLTVQVNSMPAASPPAAPTRWPHPPGPFGTLWLFVFTLAAGWVVTMKLCRGRRRLVASMAVMLGAALLFLATASCGGGGGGVGPSPTPPAPVVISITVQANGAGVSAMQSLGTLSISVN